MWLVVLRSLAVYGGTAALLLYLAHRFVLPIPRRTALLLAVAPLLFTGRALLTGGVFAPLDIAYQAEPLRSRRAELGIARTWNPLTVDVVSQMLPWRRAVREALENGRLPLWNPHLLGGAPLLAVQQPAVLHPGTWIGLLLPLPQAWTFDMTLRFLLGLLSGYLFFRGMRASEIAALFGAAAWAFSDFLVFFVGYPVTPSVAPFPLLLLGLARLAERGARRDAGLTAAALVAIVIAGHPETLLFCVTGGGIFFLFELARAGPGRRLRPVLLSFAAGAFALGLTAVLLAPFFEIVSQTLQHAERTLFFATGRRAEDLVETLRRLTSSVVPYAWGGLGRSQVVERLSRARRLRRLASAAVRGRGPGRSVAQEVGVRDDGSLRPRGERAAVGRVEPPGATAALRHRHRRLPRVPLGVRAGRDGGARARRVAAGARLRALCGRVRWRRRSRPSWSCPCAEAPCGISA